MNMIFLLLELLFPGNLGWSFQAALIDENESYYMYNSDQYVHQ